MSERANSTSLDRGLMLIKGDKRRSYMQTWYLAIDNLTLKWTKALYDQEAALNRFKARNSSSGFGSYFLALTQTDWQILWLGSLAFQLINLEHFYHITFLFIPGKA